MWDRDRFVHGNAEELVSVVGEKDFDLVYSFGVIHHTPDPAAAVREIRRLCTEDGELRVMVYERDSWKRIMIDAGLDQPEAATGCPTAFTCTGDSVRELLQGFEVVSISRDHFFPYVVEDFVEHRYVIQPHFRAMPEAMFTALDKQLG